MNIIKTIARITLLTLTMATLSTTQAMRPTSLQCKFEFFRFDTEKEREDVQDDLKEATPENRSKLEKEIQELTQLEDLYDRAKYLPANIQKNLVERIGQMKTMIAVHKILRTNDYTNKSLIIILQQAFKYLSDEQWLHSCLGPNCVD